jgi:hypothetical protein
MILYHGSTVPVDAPKILPNQRLLDFGQGFYTTTNQQQAIRWAQRVSVRRKEPGQFLSIYEFDLEQAEKDLKILHFETPDVHWLDFVCGCRMGKPPVKDYDMVFGPVADDTVYATVQLYELGVLDEAETLKRLKVQQLFDQILFHTQRALSYCKFQKSIPLGGADHG